MIKKIILYNLQIPRFVLQERLLHYVQGQEPEPKVREYFYYIDHQGMLFLDDSKIKNFTSCFKEKKFLEFFFKRIRLNKTGRFENEFPYISLCGREKNYIRCDDVPIVYTHIINNPDNNCELLSFAYAGDLLTTPFIPSKIYMLPETGRVYHPTEDKYGGIGLVRSKLAIELSKNFVFTDSDIPTHFVWNKNTFELDLNWFQAKMNELNIKINNFNQ